MLVTMVITKGGQLCCKPVHGIVRLVQAGTGPMDEVAHGNCFAEEYLDWRT